MNEFSVGDRVRITPTTGKSYAGQTGEVVTVNCTRAGTVYSCLARLDGSGAGHRSDVRVICSPRELEFVHGGEGA
jgi:hypothetical protein